MSADSRSAKVAVITGGGRGIGLAMARAFARADYSLVITGRDQARLQAAARELESTGAGVMPLSCDVTDPQSVESLLAAIGAKHAKIDVLVNNAGIAQPLTTVAKTPVATWKQVIDTNLTGTFLVTRAALPLIKPGGTIVNNLSLAAVHVFPGFGAYNASKAGALGLTNVLREELRKTGIRVLALLPGAIDTEIWGQFWPDAPREKMVSPETVAEAVLHAVSAPASTTIEEIRIGPVVGVL
jgi:NAD(P)-dependent dehydrogenase (short-subunit alcohol dehydrogenase family)